MDEKIFPEWDPKKHVVYKNNRIQIDEHNAPTVEELANAWYQRNDQWISVKERLPEDHEMVLCYSLHGKNQCVAKRHMPVYGDKYIWDDPDDIRVMQDWYITHWRPLPEGPKE